MGVPMGEIADKILMVVKNECGIEPEQVLTTIGNEYMARSDEVLDYIEEIPEITPEDIVITLKEISNPQPIKKFIIEPNMITLFNKNGEIESEPKNWIKFGSKWYFKPEIIK